MADDKKVYAKMHPADIMALLGAAMYAGPDVRSEAPAPPLYIGSGLGLPGHKYRPSQARKRHAEAHKRQRRRQAAASRKRNR